MPKRKIDQVASSGYKKLGSKFSLVRKEKIKKLKAFALVAFAAGTVVAMIWGFRSDLFSSSDAASGFGIISTDYRGVALPVIPIASCLVTPNGGSFSSQTNVEVTCGRNVTEATLFWGDEKVEGMNTTYAADSDKTLNIKGTYIEKPTYFSGFSFFRRFRKPVPKEFSMSVEFKKGGCKVYAQVMPPSCKSGRLAPPVKDANGCYGPPVCADNGSISCGGIAGKDCPSGLKCKLDGDYPDAGGKCVGKDGEPITNCANAGEKIKNPAAKSSTTNDERPIACCDGLRPVAQKDTNGRIVRGADSVCQPGREPAMTCGGIGNLQCPKPFTCKLDGDYPDAGGTCVGAGIL